MECLYLTKQITTLSHSTQLPPDSEGQIMEFHVIGTVEDGTEIDEVMDGQSQFMLTKHLKEMGVELKSITKVTPAIEEPYRSLQTQPSDGLLLATSLLGGLFIALAIIAGLIAMGEPPVIFWAIYFLIAGLGFWIIASMRAIGLTLVQVLMQRK